MFANSYTNPLRNRYSFEGVYWLLNSEYFSLISSGSVEDATFFPAFRVAVLLIEHFYILNTRGIKMIRKFKVPKSIVTAHPHVVTRANLLKEALSSWWQIHFDWLILSRKLMWRNKNLRSLLHRPDLINDKMLEINVMKDKLAIYPMKFNYIFLTGDGKCICKAKDCYWQVILFSQSNSVSQVLRMFVNFLQWKMEYCTWGIPGR